MQALSKSPSIDVLQFISLIYTVVFIRMLLMDIKCDSFYLIKGGVSPPYQNIVFSIVYDASIIIYSFILKVLILIHTNTAEHLKKYFHFVR
jgi:hypothetical protein